MSTFADRNSSMILAEARRAVLSRDTQDVVLVRDADGDLVARRVPSQPHPDAVWDDFANEWVVPSGKTVKAIQRTGNTA